MEAPLGVIEEVQRFVSPREHARLPGLSEKGSQLLFAIVVQAVEKGRVELRASEPAPSSGLRT